MVTQKLTVADTYSFIMDASPRTNADIFKGEAGFEKSKAFLQSLGDPQDAVPSIHIAGTSGKGSIAMLLTNLLVAHGFSTGTYTSPHVYKLTERWRLNGQPLTDNDLVTITQELLPTVESFAETHWGRPSYFEITTALGFLANKTKQVDYAVIETGFGGLLDTTNTITREDKLAIISQLGLDHTEILGSTLPEIAAQKAGILPKNGSAIVLKNPDPDTYKVIETVAQERNTTLRFISPENYEVASVSLEGTRFSYKSSTLEFTDLVVSLHGKHQAQNATLALQALEFLAARDGFNVQEDAVRTALQNTSLPGRFERRIIDEQTYILDGAHNPQKLGALADTLARVFPGMKFNWIMAFGKNKDALASLKKIAPLVNNLYITTFFSNQDVILSSKGVGVQELAELAAQAGISEVFVEPDSSEVLARVENNDDTPIVIAGSFYLLGELFTL